MLYFPKVGNIKFGGMKNGLPEMFQKMKITGTSKDGEENFTTLPGTEAEGYNSIQIQLPLLGDSFDHGKISFVDILDHKYYVKIVDEDVVMFPLNDRNLPVIKEKATEDIVNRLKMEDRAILFALIPTENNEFLGGGMSTFMYKTASSYSIGEIENVMAFVSKMEPKVLRHLKLTLEVTRRMINLKEKEDVSYVRLLLPSPKDVMEAVRASNELSEAGDFMEMVYKMINESKTDAIAKAVTVEQAEKVFGKKLTFKVEDILQTEVTSAPSRNTKVLTVEDEALATELSAEFSLPRPLVLTLVKISGADSRAVIEKVKTVEGIIKHIAGAEKPVNEPEVPQEKKRGRPSSKAENS
jgi:hypothetical protein